ncbi:hypothetical protein CDD80_4442 [Ophiocordyceps camponoti-rufipedis]|uniref:Uncharacterized protein n=1 Tax=Ophiocordyceps camponoti-rufipedis TaxID=2004952 RepID=A0A2C5ZIJ2_9HYPO|nr:hypothetical protein CDD80_4442 [Ophiocordyceps camponoti-rufipedis]
MSAKVLDAARTNLPEIEWPQDDIHYDDKKSARREWKDPLEQDYLDERKQKILQRRHLEIPMSFENGEEIECQDSADDGGCQHMKMLHRLSQPTGKITVDRQSWKKHMKAGQSFTLDLVGHDPYVMQALKVARDQDREEREWADSYRVHKPSTRSR